MTELTARPKRSIGTLIWLIVSQLMALGSLWIWVVVAGLSVMAFDSGQSPAVRTFWVVDRARILGWGVAQAVLLAWGSLEDYGHGWEWAIACAKLLAGLE